MVVWRMLLGGCEMEVGGEMRVCGVWGWVEGIGGFFRVIGVCIG